MKTMKFRRASLYIATVVCVSVAAGADVTYTEAPSNTDAVEVSGGTATMVGVDAFRHLRHYWSFDDASSLETDSAGDIDLVKYGSSGTLYATNDVKRGEGAVYLNSGCGYKAGTVPSFMTSTATEPFSVSFWMKGGAGGQTASRIFYFGIDARSPNGTFLDFMYTGNESNLNKFYFFGAADGATITVTEGTVDRWMHVAICCTPKGAWDGSASNLTAKLYIDGTPRATRSGVFNAGDSRVVCFGTGRNPSGTSMKPVKDTIFDEIMIFDKTLTAAEVAWVAENTRPFEFSAGWDLASDGILDIAGICAQTVRGAGTVTAETGLTLAPAASTFFAGTVAGASLTLAPESMVTQTLAAAASYTGATTVASGVLAIDPARAFPALNNTLVAYYSCDDPANPGRDDSGNGNEIVPYRESSNACVTNDGRSVGGALYFPKTEGMTYDYYQSSGNKLRGFSGTADESFNLALWARVDSRTYREGFIALDDSGMRMNNDSDKYVYHGDAGELVSYNYGNIVDGIWRHYALVYDAAPGEDGFRYRLFVNGVLKSESNKYKTSLKHGSGQLFLGRGMLTVSAAKEDFNGAVDEVFVLKGANTNDVSALYNYRRATFEVANAAAVLPEKTVLTVGSGARLFITNSFEKVYELRGAGTVEIAAGSRLEVRKCGAFTGRITGSGRFSYPATVIVIR